jgi:2-phosphosulfolactate phosphatase
VASFLNLSCACDSLAAARHVHLVCSGTNGAVTGEDVLLAGAIAEHCEQHYSAELVQDEAVIARQFWRSWFAGGERTDRDRLSLRLRETCGGRNLLRAGYQDDLDRCAEIDSLAVVPERVSVQPTRFRCPSC